MKETVKIVEIDTNPAVKSLKDLRKELLEYKNQMANLEEGSDAFLEIANKAGEVKHQIDEINQSIRGASSDIGDMVGNLTNVTAGITGAFQAVAGGFQAIGVQSEAIDKAIYRMQGLMAVTQGLSAIDNGVKSFDKLKKSIQGSATSMKAFKMLSNPVALAAIATATIAIGAAWNKWGDSIRKNLPWLDEWIKKLDGTTEKELERLQERNDAYEEYNKRLQEQAEDIRKKRALELITPEAIEQIREYEDDIILLEAEISKIQGKMNQTKDRNVWEKYNEDVLRLMDSVRQTKNEIDNLMENPKYRISNQNSGSGTPTPITGLVELDNTFFSQTRERINSYYEEVYDIQLEQLKRNSNKQEENLKAEIEIEKKRLELYTENTLQHEQQLTTIYELENKLKEITEADVEIVKSSVEQIRELGDEMFNTLKSTVDMFSDSSLGISQGWIEGLNQFQNAFKLTMDIVDKDGKTKWNDYSNVASTALGGIGTMLNTLSQEQDTMTEEGFEQQKKLQIAATIMNMLAGIMNAWTSAMSPSNAWMTSVGQIAMGTAMSGLIAGIGATQIQKINNTKFGKQFANVNVGSVGGFILPPVQQSQAVQNANTEGAIKDSKVYVLESDITTTMNKVLVQQQENYY